MCSALKHDIIVTHTASQSRCFLRMAWLTAGTRGTSTASAHEMPVAPSAPSCDRQKRSWTLSNVPWGQSSLRLRTSEGEANHYNTKSHKCATETLLRATGRWARVGEDVSRQLRALRGDQKRWLEFWQGERRQGGHSVSAPPPITQSLRSVYANVLSYILIRCAVVSVSPFVTMSQKHFFSSICASQSGSSSVLIVIYNAVTILTMYLP